MSWATVATIAGVGAFVALITVIAWIIYNQGKKIGIQQGKEDECKKVDNATAHLAKDIYNDDPNSDFKLLHPDSWKPPPKT